jgi:TP901 family phage tail tape measure protein
MAQSISKVYVDMVARTASFDGPIKRSKKNLQGFGLLAVTTGKKLKALSSGFSSMALKAAAAALAIRQIGRAIKGSIAPSATLEENLNRVSSVMGNLPTEAFDALKKKARELGRTTEFTAGQAAGGLRFLGMAGLSANEALQAIGPSLSLASAGAIDLGEAADHVTNIMGQMGLSFDQTERAVDVLAKTTTSSNTNVLELAEAFKFAGPTARALGVDLEEIAATIGVLANSGLKAGIGTRALSTALAGLASPEVGRKLKDQLNISAFGDTGDFIGIINLIEEMNKSFEGMTKHTRLAVISDVFGKNALQEMDVLLTAGAGKLRSFKTELLDAGGSAKAIAENNLKGLNGQLKKLSSAFQDVLISIGEAGLLDLFSELARRATEFFKTLADSKVVFDFFKGAAKRMRTQIEFLITAGKIFVLGFAGIAIIVKKVMNNIVSWVDAAIAGIVGAWRSSMRFMANVILQFGQESLASLNLVLNGVESVLTAVGRVSAFGFRIDTSGMISSLAGARAAINESFGGFNETITANLAIDENVLIPDVASIQGTIDSVGDSLSEFIKDQKGKLDLAWYILTKPLEETVPESAKEAFVDVKKTIKEFNDSDEVKELGEKAKEFSRGWVRFGVTMRDTLVDATINFKTFGGFVDTILTKMRENIVKTLILGKADAVGNRAGGLLDVIFSAGTGNAIGGFFQNLFKANGGPVNGGSSYVVGERGPELFTPTSSGSITSNAKMGQGGRSGQNVLVNNYFDIRGSDEETQKMIASSVRVSVAMAVAEGQNLKNRGVIR